MIMKKRLAVLAVAAGMFCGSVLAAVPITKVDKVSPTDEIYMDMATSAASKAAKGKGLPCGAVVILNNAFRSAGTASADVTAEQNAIAKAGLSSLQNAVIYTVNEPTTDAYNDICRFGADAVFFVNPREKVIEAGIYPASAYDDSRIDTGLTQVPMKQLDYSDAEALLK